MAGQDPGGLDSRWVTYLLTLVVLSLATGLVAAYGLNLSFSLDAGPFSDVRLRLAPLDATWLFRTSLYVLVTPVLALGASPLALALHVVALTALLGTALNRLASLGPAPRLLVLLGLALAFLAPLPGVFGYPHFVSQVIVLVPRYLIPIVLFFGDPLVRFGFPLLAYALPALGLLLARQEPERARPRGPPRLGPALLLLSLMSVAMLLILLGDFWHRVAGLLLNAALLPAGLLLWALHYRPRLPRLSIADRPTWLSERLYAWRNPAATFVLTVVLILLLTALEPVEHFVEASALGHHGQHLALVAVGLVQGGVVYQVARTHRRRQGLAGEMARFVYVGNVLYNRGGWPGVLFAGSVVALWHVPLFWDLALREPLVHGLEHALFVAAGSALAFSLDRMRLGAQYALLVAAMAAMGLFSLSLWFAPGPVYATYPQAELALLGKVHFLVGMPLMILVAGMTLAACRDGAAMAGAEREGRREEPSGA